MNAQRYFQRFGDVREQIAELEMKYAMAKDAATRITTRPFDGMPHAPGVSDKVGENAQKMADYANQIMECHFKLWDMQEKAIPLLMEATHTTKNFQCNSFQVVSEILIDGKSPKTVAETYGLHHKYIYTKLKNVYKRLDEKYPDMSIFL